MLSSSGREVASRDSIGRMNLLEILSASERQELLAFKDGLALSEAARRACAEAQQGRINSLVPEAAALGLGPAEAETLAYVREAGHAIVLNGPSPRVTAQRAANNSKG